MLRVLLQEGKKEGGGMKYIAILSLAAFAVYPEMFVLIPAATYAVLKVGRVFFDRAMSKLTQELHEETWKR